MDMDTLQALAIEDESEDELLRRYYDGVLDLVSIKRELRVVAIDDNKVDLEILRRHLRGIPEWEVKLISFEKVEAAWSILESGELDVLLIDYMIGSESGIDAIRDIRSCRGSFPMILMTGAGSEEVAVHAMQTGAADYLAKGSLSSSCLRRSISNAIQKTKLLQAVKVYRENLEQTVKSLAKRNQQIVGFYHTVSHELKTPLASANEFLSLVLDGIAGALTPDQFNYLRLVQESVQQVKTLVNDLLDSARLDTGKFRISKAPSVLGLLVLKCLDSIVLSARLKNISLERRIADNLPKVSIDEIRIQQVLVNLVGNAIKFTPEGGKVTVSAALSERQPGMVEVSVQDNGPGMDAKQAARVFEPFYQLDNEPPGTDTGLGIGLSIARELVQLNGGEIWVDAEPGKGSHFHFTVPIAGKE